MAHSYPPATATKTTQSALTIAALGIVFGDIGTSPLYTIRAALASFGELTPDVILGVLSLLFWMLVWVVSFKYVFLILRVDNRGEGGTLALMELALKNARGRKRRVLMVAGLLGACLFYGDTVITPTISVLSAVEGVLLISPELQAWVAPAAALFILLLFSIQKRGTGSIGRWFGAVMLGWFVLIGALGLWHIVQTPQILLALDPRRAWALIWQAPWQVYVLLGALVLALTGAETLYADMGHFGRRTISRAWFMVVLPALLCCYFGQGALLLAQPHNLINPFFLLAPQWGIAPLVVLAMIASIIASQAVISGAFSMTRQAIQLGFWPRMRILHTSAQTEGQIYLPRLNQWLCAAILLLIFGFGSSEALTHAYGFAVTGTMLVTTILAFGVLPGRVLPGRKYRIWRRGIIALLLLFLLFDVILLTANLPKFLDGGWLPMLIGASLLTLMLTWQQGRRKVHAQLSENSLPLRDFMQALQDDPASELARVSGTAVFMSMHPGTVPPALLHNLKHNKVLHGQTLFLTVRTARVPYIPFDRRYQLERLSRSSWQVVAQWGFKQAPDVPALLAQMASGHPQLNLDPMTLSFFLSRHTLVQVRRLPWHRRWRRALYAFMARNAVRSSGFYNIAPNRVVEMGMQLEL